jgi:hypothetical protein
MLALRLTPASLEKIWERQIAREALAAAGVLKRQARSRPALHDALERMQAGLMDALEEAQNAIRATYAADRRALDLLKDEATEIEEKVPALMLLPEAGLIDRLVSALEEAHGEDRLSDHEHLLLSRLRRLKGDLARMNPKDASHWRSIAREFEHLAEPAAAPIHPAGSGKLN